MFSAPSVRNRGWVLIINQAVDVYHSGEPDARVKFTGGTGMIWFMFGVLGLVFSFGVASIVNGIWQVRYGKRNSHLASILFGLYAVLGVIVALVWLLSPAQESIERRTVQPPPLTTPPTR